MRGACATQILSLSQKTSNCFGTTCQIRLTPLGPIPGPAPALRPQDCQGRLEFFGRRDAQVKVRGFRIELSEIESVVAEHPAVRAAVVDVRSTAGSPQLVAFLILEGPATAEGPAAPAGSPEGALVGARAPPDVVAGVLEVCRARLAPYMVPVRFWTVPYTPQSPSRKAERRLLLEPDLRTAADPDAAATDDTGFRDALSPVGRTVADAWDALLGGPGTVGDGAADFFQLGGHSLLVSKLVSELRRHDGLQYVSAKDLYEHSTFADFVACVEPTGARQLSHAGIELKISRTREEQQKTISNAVVYRGDLLQALALYVLSALALMHTFGVLVVVLYIVNLQESWVVALAFVAGYLLVVVYSIFFTVAVKWLVIGRYKEGSYPLWGSYHVRWWFVAQIQVLCRPDPALATGAKQT